MIEGMIEVVVFNNLDKYRKCTVVRSTDYGVPVYGVQRCSSFLETYPNLLRFSCPGLWHEYRDLDYFSCWTYLY